ncbi:MAG: hypothetical protein LBR10_13640 [Prevotellaceae bacterium]|jgi:hypothetical protein|nr:hypothetical protein [Prevotellaceae bacterium]
MKNQRNQQNQQTIEPEANVGTLVGAFLITMTVEGQFPLVPALNEDDTKEGAKPASTFGVEKCYAECRGRHVEQWI